MSQRRSVPASGWKIFFLGAVCVLGLGIFARAAETLTYADLINRLVDLEHLATLPPEGEKTAQFSSYNRASYYDAENDKYVAWDFNADGAGFIRPEGEDGAVVIAEMEGPGCIWRLWSAGAGGGHFKVYLDGEETPAIDQPFSYFFGDAQAPWLGFGLCYGASRGFNSYVPIPYRKSCKIVAEKGWGAYYLINYTTFAPGTVVPTFQLPVPEEDLEVLADVNRILESERGRDPAGRRPGQVETRAVHSIPPGGEVVVFDREGPAAITALRARVLELKGRFEPQVVVRLDERENGIPTDKSTQLARRTLRNLILKIAWDGNDEYAVWSPLGDFFGSAPGINPNLTLVNGVDQYGRFRSFWYMPHARARIVLENRGDEPLNVDFGVTHAPLTRPLADFARFHAKWHSDLEPPVEPERAIDWPLLRTQGRGRFVGTVLNIWNPKGGWWGEGDEKFFVDGEKFPSTYGTGSEDYFGYAWCSPMLFSKAFHSQSISDNHMGHASNNRWHISDQLPFHTAFEATIEKYRQTGRPRTYTAVAYWYLAPDGVDPIAPTEKADMPTYEGDPSFDPTRIPKRYFHEAEKLKILDFKSETGKPYVDRIPWSHLNLNDDEHFRFGKFASGGAAMRLQRQSTGDGYTLELPVERDGKYRVFIQLLKSEVGGVYQFKIDEQPLGEPVDSYSYLFTPTGDLELGEMELTAGNHRFELETVKQSEVIKQATETHLDYIILEEVLPER